MPTPLRILLSQQAVARLGAEIAQVLGAQPYELVSIESAVADGRTDIDIAFISREVTGLSTKHELAPSLHACYEVLRRATGLAWLHIHSAGTDRPIYMALRARGVTITTSSGTSAEVVAHSAVAGLLALARRFPQLMAAQRERRWAPLLAGQQPRDLGAQTVLLVGWGPIGQRIGAFVRLLGMRLLVVRTQATPSTEGVEMLTFAEFHQALPRADWLVLAGPLSEQTRGLVDARALAALPRGAHLVNVARGELVDEPALIAALQAGHLGGAFLDVFAHEPLAPNSPLWSLPNVIATPHSAGHSDGNEARVAALFLDNLRRRLAQQPLRNVAR